MFMLTISEVRPKKKIKKWVVVISARVHSGETNASYVF